MKFLLGLILGLLILPACVFFYFRFGSPPVAVLDLPFPLEREIVRTPLGARIEREMPKTPPMSASETNMLIGVHIYRENCAACHGLYGRPTPYADHMYPNAPQLWQPHGSGVVGVSDDPPGETYWKVKNGIRLTGMPSFKGVLNETQMWQVTLLLANADKPLPNGVLDLLKQPLNFDPPAAQALPPVPETK
ncbi:cytochrome c [Alloacidobacterium dinghuense]|uniref:Cytochrome c n=1 Tax=Alloacidobacterium dinghuense TaxID=2763107 RepID=A0A7G8BIY1_9BACT|nr:cytochrome c [Alloacidobacterium dinghuense]QNI32501.1 cytochrome c [Alloacidobacterium dinghuense]